MAPPATAPAPAQVGGVVVDDSGRPQYNAIVDLRGSALRYRRATDSYGHFLFFEFHGTERVWLQAFRDSLLSRRSFVNPPDTTVRITVSPMRDGTLRLAEAYLTRKVEHRTAEVAIRTWSSKRILPRWKGLWWVDVLSEAGRPLDVRFFTIAAK